MNLHLINHHEAENIGILGIWPFGIFYGNLVCLVCGHLVGIGIDPVLLCLDQESLATLRPILNFAPRGKL
jgi:hypothetical protein